VNGERDGRSLSHRLVVNLGHDAATEEAIAQVHDITTAVNDQDGAQVGLEDAATVTPTDAPIGGHLVTFFFRGAGAGFDSCSTRRVILSATFRCQRQSWESSTAACVHGHPRSVSALQGPNPNSSAVIIPSSLPGWLSADQK